MKIITDDATVVNGNPLQNDWVKATRTQSFNIHLADTYGLNAAIIFDVVSEEIYIINHSGMARGEGRKAGTLRVTDGEYWLFASLTDWQAKIKYLSEEDILDGLTVCAEAELLAIDNIDGAFRDAWFWVRPERSSGAPKIAKKPASLKGYVYLMCGGGYHKIGLSIHPPKRHEQISPVLPFQIEILHVIATPNTKSLEKFWHDKFSFARQCGEWFVLSPEQIAEFCAQAEMAVPNV